MDVLLFAAIAWWGAGVFPDMEKMLATRPRIKRVIERVGNIDVVSMPHSRILRVA